MEGGNSKNVYYLIKEESVDMVLCRRKGCPLNEKTRMWPAHPICLVSFCESMQRGKIKEEEIRKKANIKAGDKLAVVCWGEKENVHCISLIKADGLEGVVKNVLGPMMKEMM